VREHELEGLDDLLAAQALARRAAVRRHLERVYSPENLVRWRACWAWKAQEREQAHAPRAASTGIVDKLVGGLKERIDLG